MKLRTPVDWAGYITQFHESRPGVLEDVFSRATAGGHTPYSWLTRAVSPHARTILDLSCASGRMGRELDAEGRTVVGVDSSMPELRMAMARGAEQDAADGFPETSIGRQGAWICGSTLRLPVATASMDVVVTLMGFRTIRPLPVLMAEAARVLRPGGMLAILAPGPRIMPARDARVLAQLFWTLRAQPRFPKRRQDTEEPVSLTKLTAAAGLRKLESKRELYRYPVFERLDAERLLQSIYLPSTPQKRVDAAIDHLAKQAAKGGSVEVAIPMRRFVAVK